jgi:hypothetical protein
MDVHVERKNVIKIGGEFGIDPHILYRYPEYKPSGDIFLYSSGRIALLAILNHVRKNKKSIIHIPYYICEAVVKVCENAGFKVKFYEPDERFLLPVDYLSDIKINEVLLTVNYFGYIDDNRSIIKIKELRPDISVISDQVQSFWTYDKTCADFSFTSLRKHFAIPDGALVFTKDKAFKPGKNIPETQFYKNKLIGSILKNQQVQDEIYLNFFESGEKELDNETMISQASILGYYLFNKLELDTCKKRRRENSKLVYEVGQKHGLEFIFPLNEEVIPMHVPVYLEKRDKIRNELKNSDIYLPIHWPQADFNLKSRMAKRMKEMELSLVIDQRYSPKDIEYELETLIKIL